MPYERKTEDEYQILADYGEGLEEIHAEETRKGAIEAVKAYRENEPGRRFTWRKRRVPKQ